MDTLKKKNQTIIGFDLGSKSLGIAIKNKLGMVFPLPALFFKSVDEIALRKSIQPYIENYQPHVIIFGIPYHADGRESDQTRWVKGVVARLQPFFTIPIEMVDERLTTIEAKERLHALGIPEKKQKQYIDSLSACVILEQYESKPR
ncbi:MAG: Holliday junction resolvase RuvX [Bacilli bacterium]